MAIFIFMRWAVVEIRQGGRCHLNSADIALVILNPTPARVYPTNGGDLDCSATLAMTISTGVGHLPFSK